MSLLTLEIAMLRDLDVSAHTYLDLSLRIDALLEKHK